MAIDLLSMVAHCETVRGLTPRVNVSYQKGYLQGRKSRGIECAYDGFHPLDRLRRVFDLGRPSVKLQWAGLHALLRPEPGPTFNNPSVVAKQMPHSFSSQLSTLPNCSR